LRLAVGVGAGGPVVAFERLEVVGFGFASEVDLVETGLDILERETKDRLILLICAEEGEGDVLGGGRDIPVDVGEFAGGQAGAARRDEEERGVVATGAFVGQRAAGAVFGKVFGRLAGPGDDLGLGVGVGLGRVGCE